MLMTLQIGVGIWLGGLFLVGTLVVFVEVKDRIEKNRRQRQPWHRGLLSRA